MFLWFSSPSSSSTKSWTWSRVSPLHWWRRSQWGAPWFHQYPPACQPTWLLGPELRWEDHTTMTTTTTRSSFSYLPDPVKGWGGEWYLDILELASELEVHHTSTHVPARVRVREACFKGRLFVIFVIFPNPLHSIGFIVERIVQSIIINNSALAVLQAIPCLYLQLVHTIQLLGRADLGLKYHTWGRSLTQPPCWKVTWSGK